MVMEREKPVEDESEPVSPEAQPAPVEEPEKAEAEEEPKGS